MPGQLEVTVDVLHPPEAAHVFADRANTERVNICLSVRNIRVLMAVFFIKMRILDNYQALYMPKV